MSADKDYVLPSSESEALRLERQAELYGGAAFLRPYLAALPDSVLDVGCGTGFFTRHVAEQLRQSIVVGADQDRQRLRWARSHTSSPNACYQLGDLDALPFADNSFDLVFCRFVLVHATDPTTALQEMARVTRPGGLVVAHDMVHDGIWFSPPKPGFAELLGQIIEVMRKRGMEPSQGLHLASGMIRAGLDEVQVQVLPHQALAREPSFEIYRQNWVDTLSGLDQILGRDFDAGLLERALKELDRRGDDEFLLELSVLAQGRKPKADHV